MREHTFAASRFEETSLSTDTYLIGVITSGRTSPVRCSNVRGFVGKFMRAAVEFAKGLSGGLHAAYAAERYYAMSDAELARVGLTRDRIPEELRRMC